jgi:hypothetical protein
MCHDLYGKIWFVKGVKMKKTDWQMVATQTRELYPNVIQIATYSRNRWLLVFEEEPDNFLSTFHPLARIIEKLRISTPLIISKQFIQNSLDSYPLEFLDIFSDYANLFIQEDMIVNLQFDKNDVRLQVERELKGKWLLTRLAALQHKKRTRRLFGILHESFNSLIPVFKGFCFLNGTNPPKETEKLLDNMEEILHADLRVFRYLVSQKKTPSEILVNNLFNDYIRLLNLCSEKIDSWKFA